MGRALIQALLAGCMLSGCGVSYLRPADPVTAPDRPRDRLWAGVEEIDITPPIGLGMWGHGPESRVSIGIAQRLRCQVFVISGPSARTPDATETLALVPCDLPAMGLYVQRAVASYVGRYVAIPAQRIAIMATHTHYAPGHFLAAGGWTGPFSARVSGFDRDFAEELGKRIGAAIVRAYYRARPARIAWGYKDLRGIARNRALAALLQNDPLPAKIATALKDAPDEPDLAAIDPLLSVMRIDQWLHEKGRYVPAGLLAFYGVHPSVVGNHNALYTGDLFGYATRHARGLIRRDASFVAAGGDRFIVGLANGLEGDVTSARARNTHEEAQRLGHLLGGEIAEVWTSLGQRTDDPRETKGPLDAAYRELRWAGAELSGGRHLCRHPGQGTPAAGGASDHLTAMRIWPPADPGVRAVRPDGEPPCGWPRYALLGIDPAGEDGASYPHVAPIMLARIGRGLIATAPAELTTVAGFRIRERLGSVLPEGCDRITMVGLTNEYVGYIATREEYQLQYYEGASTLYGPDSAEFLKEQFYCLAKGFAGEVGPGVCFTEQPAIDETIDAPYAATTIDVYSPPSAQDTSAVPTELSPIETRVRGRAVTYSVRFEGIEPGKVRSWKDLEVSVELAGATVADGQGEDMRVLYDERTGDHPWRVEWIAPSSADDPLCGKELRFRLKTRGGSVQSEPFSVACKATPAPQACP